MKRKPPTVTERTVSFRTPPDGLEPAHETLAALWAEREDIGDMDRMMFETALIELTSNVIQHATSTVAIVCRLTIEADDSTIRAVLVDSADPPDIDTGPRVMPDEFAESGRGIAFIQALVDEFDHDRVGAENIWTISKTLAASGS